VRLALKLVTYNGENFVHVVPIECILCIVPYVSTKIQYADILLIATEPSVFISTLILTFC
jgi:hypothetical protein